MFYSGTSGLVLPYNKDKFPPDYKDKSRLQYYASLFNSLEVNSIFYKLPRPATVAKWAESVPEDFKFTFKMPKSITHAPQFNFEKQEVANFMNVVNQANTKEGCLLVQFPPSVTIEKIERLEKLLATLAILKQSTPWKIAVEFRNTTWYTTEVYDLLDRFNATMVLHDMKLSETQWISATKDVLYLRFHGPEPKYRGSYSDEFLQQRAHDIKKWILEKKTVYVYFNNTLGGAFHNLQTLNTFVHFDQL